MNEQLPAGHNLQTRLKSTLLGVVGSFVLFAAYLAIPPIGIFSGIVAPFPAAYNHLKYGRLAALTVLFGVTTIITALFGVFAGVLYFGMCGVIGAVMPNLLLRGFSASRTLFWTTALNVLFCAIGFLVYSYLSGTDLPGLINAEVASSMKQAIAIYEKAGVKGEELDLLKRSMTAGIDMLAKLYPALITVLLIIIAGANLALLKKTSATITAVSEISDFSSFRTHDLLVWLLIISGFSLLLPTSIITTPALNVLAVALFLYLLQGMAVISTIAARYSVSRFLRILLYATLIIQPYFLAFVAGVGLFDLWVDFRTPKPQENL
jgi:uncharacterized protein YybS (DUF2232 family)